jgi:hypothetical protein
MYGYVRHFAAVEDDAEYDFGDAVARVRICEGGEGG